MFVMTCKFGFNLSETVVLGSLNQQVNADYFVQIHKKAYPNSPTGPSFGYYEVEPIAEYSQIMSIYRISGYPEPT